MNRCGVPGWRPWSMLAAAALACAAGVSEARDISAQNDASLSRPSPRGDKTTSKPSPRGDRKTASQRARPMKTLGGRQFWGDVAYFHDWRIQRHVLTGHYRLLDDGDYRHASGTLETCQAALEDIRRQRGLPPMSGTAVVLVHGILRSSKSFSRMRARLEEEGYQVFGFDYPSSQIPITEAAEYLHHCLQSLEGIEEIHLVVHSMGGLVVRCYLSQHRDPRLRRLVMCAVPNRGAEMADLVKKNLLYRAVFGPAGQQLVTGEDCLGVTLPVPDFEFGIIAGARGAASGFNPLIPGDDDGTITVACTRLSGAADFVTVRALHSFLIRNDEAIGCVLRFLKTGRFRAEGEPEPIPPGEGEGTVEQDVCLDPE